MRTENLDLLVLDGHAADTRLLQAQIADAAPGRFRLTVSDRLDEALRHLGEKHFDAVLTDLDLPDSEGLDTVRAVRRRANGAALVVLSGTTDDSIAMQAVRDGAQDYLVKGEASANSVLRAICNAVERKDLERRLRDAVTGLERRITERTAELERYNQELQAKIGERRAAEERARQLGGFYAILCQINECIARATDENSLLRDASNAIAAHDDYVGAGFAAIDVERGRLVPGMVSAGFEEVARGLQVSLDASDPHGRGPTAIAAREERDVFVNDFLHDAADGPWEGLARKLHVRSAAALPLRRSGRMAGVFSIYSRKVDFFGAEERALARRLAENLSYGLDSLRRAAERDRALAETEFHAKRVEQAMLATVRAVSSIVEQRDPYTSGHQRRVGDLMAAIGAEMGLDADRCRGLRVIGEVHDVGKIGLPAQILSKPGALTPIEMELVRAHPQAGYEVLHGIDFPWPVADAVRQHHERLDGSGYPRQLSGEAIILEARILAVADVVEAITSHRPYRPSLGIEVALRELEMHTGTRFCPRAAAACLRLFRDQNYRLPD